MMQLGVATCMNVLPVSCLTVLSTNTLGVYNLFYTQLLVLPVMPDCTVYKYAWHIYHFVYTAAVVSPRMHCAVILLRARTRQGNYATGIHSVTT